MQNYADRMILPLVGFEDICFYTKTGLQVAYGYVRVVLGGRGPYVEFETSHILNDNFHIPPECEYRKTDKGAYYIEARSIDSSNVKLYFQRKTVGYADYIVGKVYISPFDLVSDKYPVLVRPLSGN